MSQAAARRAGAHADCGPGPDVRDRGSIMYALAFAQYSTMNSAKPLSQVV